MKHTKETYDELMRLSYGYRKSVQRYTTDWVLFKTLYENNYLQSEDTEAQIPKTIHQIWLGGQLPEKYKRYTESWLKINSSWDYKLWGDADVESLHMKNKKVFDATSNLGMKSDIMRYEILNKFGGVYVDTDFECLKPLDDLSYLNFYTGISYDIKAELYIGLLASTPGHPIMKACVEGIKTPYVGNKPFTIFDLTGPYYFTRCFIQNVSKETKGVVAFPPAYFYPLPNNKRKDENAYNFVRECSYAIHHWGVSWF